jgi:protein CMS1
LERQIFKIKFFAKSVDRANFRKRKKSAAPMSETADFVKKRKRSSKDQRDEMVAPSQPLKRRQVEGDIDESIAHMDASLLADHIAKNIRRFLRRTRGVELEDQYLPQKIFRDTSEFKMPRSLENLPTFLERFGDSETGLSSDLNAGSPRTLIVAASGIRAADLTR